MEGMGMQGGCNGAVARRRCYLPKRVAWDPLTAQGLAHVAADLRWQWYDTSEPGPSSCACTQVEEPSQSISLVQLTSSPYSHV